MARKRATHTNFTPGKRVYVKLTSGEQFIDRFLEKRDRAVFLEQRGKVLNADITSMTIYRSKEGQG
jgi:hypothetical protein